MQCLKDLGRGEWVWEATDLIFVVGNWVETAINPKLSGSMGKRWTFYEHIDVSSVREGHQPTSTETMGNSVRKWGPPELRKAIQWSAWHKDEDSQMDE